MTTRKTRKMQSGFGRDFDAYDPDIYTAIPLHWPFLRRTEHRGKSTVIREMGKVPMHPKWTKLRYSTPKVIEACRAEKRNMGIRLASSQLVLDVDPRSGGDEGLAELCATLGDKLDLKKYPAVLTGGGGWHYYMTKPADLEVTEKLARFPGIEFKATGRQVLAAGCVHPTTGRLYSFAPGHPGINTRVPAPKALLRLIKARVTLRTGGDGDEDGAIPCELAAEYFAHIPAEFFCKENYGDWVSLGAAMKHATGGAALAEWLEWCRSDPEYDNEAAQEQARIAWDSFKRTEGKLATIGTLVHIGEQFFIPEPILKALKSGHRIRAAESFNDELTTRGSL